jgi:hypothetical protein
MVAEAIGRPYVVAPLLFPLEILFHDEMASRSETGSGTAQTGDRMKPRRLVPQLALSVFHLIDENEILLVRVIQS